MRTARTWSHLLVLLAAFAITRPAHAGWPEHGNPICVALGVQNDITVLADGTGGSYVVWRDERRGSGISDLYASRVDADGTLHAGWPVDGLVLVQSGSVGRPWPVVTATGQLMIGWFDIATFTFRLQRYSESGVRDPNFPAGGITTPIFVGAGGENATILRMASDGAEGAYVLCNRLDFTSSNDPLFLTRVSATGAIAPGWTSTGQQVAGGSFQLLLTWRSVELAPDGSGGAWVTETHTEDGGIGPNFLVGSQVHARSDGVLSFAFMDPSGYLDGFGHFQTYLSTATAAPAGGADSFAVWRLGGPSGPQFYLRRHLSTGGVTAAAVPAPVDLQMLADGAGGVYLLGLPVTPARLELHRRTASLTVPAGWGSGVVLSTATSYPAIKSVRSGSNVYVGWSNGASGSEDLLASAVTQEGVLSSGWGTEGSVVSGAPGAQILTGMAAGNAGDAYAAWVDTRSGNGDVYLARLGPNGPIVTTTLGVGDGGKVALAVARSTPNPQSTQHARVAFSLATDADATLELLDVTGRVAVRQDLAGLTAGAHSVELDTHGALPPGLYFVRLTQGAQRAQARITLIH